MAAEKWLKFIEVKQYNLIDYLVSLKASGYVLVGAEQTAYGVQLHKTALPKKMVLIMGLVCADPFNLSGNTRKFFFSAEKLCTNHNYPTNTSFLSISHVFLATKKTASTPKSSTCWTWPWKYRNWVSYAH